MTSVAHDLADPLPDRRREAGMTQATREIDGAAFTSLIEPHRRELHAHCYRMLGSVHDADDALQETLLGAWKGLPGFEGRSSLRSWLYTIATHASLRVLDGRRRRALPDVTGDAHDPGAPLGRPLAESVWIEPYPDEVERYEDRESVELAYVAALQLLAPNQRAALLLCDVLGFSARETADMLETSVASVNSALQRARAKLALERPARSQQATLRALGDERSRALVAQFVDAWNRADVAAIVAMLTRTRPSRCRRCPPGSAATTTSRRSSRGAIFRSAWRFEPTSASGQPAMLCRRRDPDERALRAPCAHGVHVRGRTHLCD